MIHRVTVVAFCWGVLMMIAFTAKAEHAGEYTGPYSTFTGVTKGKPFQTQYEESRVVELPDGQLRYETTKGGIYRDSEGRTRTDVRLEISSDLHGELAFIADPTIQRSFALNHLTKTAVVEVLPPETGKGGWYFLQAGKPTELPGTYEVEGLVCRRLQFERQGEEVQLAESWICDELVQAVFENSISKGQQSTWRLFNIRLVNPDPLLFAVPPDYTIVANSKLD